MILFVLISYHVVLIMLFVIIHIMLSLMLSMLWVIGSTFQVPLSILWFHSIPHCTPQHEFTILYISQPILYLDVTTLLLIAISTSVLSNLLCVLSSLLCSC